MNKTKHLSRESALQLIREAGESCSRYTEEALQAFESHTEMSGRKAVLERTQNKTSSGAAFSLIQKAIIKLAEEIGGEKKRQRIAETNKENYAEVKRALEKTLGEI